MALDFLRRPETRDAEIADLTARVDGLALDLARALRRIEALERAARQDAPALENCDSARKLMAHIGRTSLGLAGDTAHLPVRTALLKHDGFADLRDALAARGGSIVADEKILRWLAEPAKMNPSRTRFAVINDGILSARALAESER